MKLSAASWERRSVDVWELSALFGGNCAACSLPDVG